MGTYVIVKRTDDGGELYHHGTKGQKWGRRLYQNHDGSLTPLGRLRYGSGGDGKSGGGKASAKKVSRKVRKQRAAALEKARQAKAEKAEEKKTLEETRAKLLKSSDAKELYENRHLLTTAELNDRINRIDMEAKLASRIVTENKQTGVDYVNSKMKTATDTLGNATALFKKVDEAYSSVTNSAIGKTLAKKLGLEPPKAEITLDNVMKNLSKYSNKEIQDYSQRFKNEKNIIDEFNRREKKAKEEAEAAADKKAKEEAKAAADKKAKEDKDAALKDAADKKAKEETKEAVDKKAKEETKEAADKKAKEEAKEAADKKAKEEAKAAADKKAKEETVERYEASGKDVIGKGNSRFNGWKSEGKEFVQDVVVNGDKAYNVSNSTELVVSGRNYLSDRDDWK